MSYVDILGIGVKKDSAAIDAFGRLRTSSPTTLFDSKQIVDDLPLFYDDQETSGSGTSSTYDSDTASTTLSVSATTAGTRVRQTHRRFNYHPGKSQFIALTTLLGAGASGITRRVGYFDENNGVFFQLDDSTLSVGIRTSTSGSPSDTTVAQSSWNVDTLDGTTSSRSGYTLDVTKSQVFFFDFEWLGVGRVRFGVYIEGVPVVCHEFHNFNTLTTSTVVYMSTPNLPVRYEISNDGTGAASDLIHLCSSVISEGGAEETGVQRAAGRAASSITLAGSNAWTPLVSLRLKSTHLGITVKPINYSVASESTGIYEVALGVSPTVGGTDAVSWVNVSDSAVQYDISRTNANTLTAPFWYEPSLIVGTPTAKQPINAEQQNALALGSMIDGTPTELVLMARNLSGSAQTVFASIAWRELL